MTDRRTDRRTGKNNMSGGDIKIKQIKSKPKTLLWYDTFINGQEFIHLHFRLWYLSFFLLLFVCELRCTGLCSE